MSDKYGKDCVHIVTNELIDWGERGIGFWLSPIHGFSFDIHSNKNRRKFLKYNGLNYKDVPRCKGCSHVFFNCVCNDMEYKKKIDRMKELYAMSFEDKLKYSEELVLRVMDKMNNKRMALAYSGGIDSECCINLFKDYIISDRIKVFVGITRVNFNDALLRMKELESELDVRFLRAYPERGINFRVIVEKYGLPLYSRGSIDKSKARATDKCCSYLKKKPMDKMGKYNEVLIMGLRGKENNYRKLAIYNRGDYFYSKSYRNWRVYPIAFWDIEDVWNYQESKGFGYNVIYDNTNISKKGFYKLNNGKIYQIRTGCWCCPQATRGGYLEWLSRYYPDYHNQLKYLWSTTSKKGVM